MIAVPRGARRLGAAASLVLVALGAASCAYYNTFYMAKKYYYQATAGDPYPVDKTTTATVQTFNKSIEYSKKVIGIYPNSKWVDDAYLLWARSMIGKDDPLQAVTMLQDFATRFPKSPLKVEALFYLGVAQRLARKHRDAEAAFAGFLEQAPRHDLGPYAWLERSRTLTALERHVEAAAAASEIVERHRKHKLYARALAARAEARFLARQYAEARQDFHVMGNNAVTDDERLNFLLREVDCLEQARDYGTAMSLLQEALRHETEPVPTTTTAGAAAPGTTTPIAAAPTTPANDRWGRIMVRIGTIHLLAGRVDEALAAYRRVVLDYPRTPIGAEAQYRTGYAYETVADDFEKARAEYTRVRETFATSPFAAQAQQRAGNLDRVAQFRTAGGDTTEKRAEAGFLLAELYLFQHEKPDKALEQYRTVAREFTGTAWEAKAKVAEGWVLARKLERPAEAETLWWDVVRHHPATEAQLAARDYLELVGQAVPNEMIRMPERRVAVVDTTKLAAPPSGPMPLGTPPIVPAPGGRVSPPGRFRTLPPGQWRSTWDPPTVSSTSGAPLLPGDSPARRGPGTFAPATPAPEPGTPVVAPTRPALGDSLPGRRLPRVKAPSDSTGKIPTP